jgi:RNA polymerase sigma factor (sigma-70 family)
VLDCWLKYYYHIFILIFFLPALLAALTTNKLFRRCSAIPADEPAWCEFFQRYHPDIEAAIYRVIGFPPQGHHAHLYQDVLQGFHLRLLENECRALRSFRGETDNEARAFLRKVAASVACNTLNQEQRPPHVPLDLQEDDSLSPSESLLDPSALNERYFMLRQAIDDCLEQVLRGHNKERNIKIFKLAVYDGLSPREIAELPDFKAVTLHAIEQQITRTRHKMRPCLNKK